jgi:hypothetical protein
LPAAAAVTGGGEGAAAVALSLVGVALARYLRRRLT